MQKQQSGIRRTQSITDAIYGKGRKSTQRPSTGPKREVDPRRTFSIASQLDPETLRKLEALADPKSRRRK